MLFLRFGSASKRKRDSIAIGFGLDAKPLDVQIHLVPRLQQLQSSRSKIYPKPRLVSP